MPFVHTGSNVGSFVAIVDRLRSGVLHNEREGIAEVQIGRRQPDLALVGDGRQGGDQCGDQGENGKQRGVLHQSVLSPSRGYRVDDVYNMADYKFLSSKYLATLNHQIYLLFSFICGMKEISLGLAQYKEREAVMRRLSIFVMLVIMLGGMVRGVETCPTSGQFGILTEATDYEVASIVADVRTQAGYPSCVFETESGLWDVADGTC